MTKIEKEKLIGDWTSANPKDIEKFGNMKREAIIETKDGPKAAVIDSVEPITDSTGNIIAYKTKLHQL